MEKNHVLDWLACVFNSKFNICVWYLQFCPHIYDMLVGDFKKNLYI